MTTAVVYGIGYELKLNTSAIVQRRQPSRIQ
jgi:hypothetical protein